MHLSGHTNVLMNLIKILWFGVCCQFFSPEAGSLPGVALSGEQPPAACGALRAKNIWIVSRGGWINFMSVYSYICFSLLCVYILLSFCHAMCMYAFIWHDTCTLTATPIYLYFSLYIDHSCICWVTPTCLWKSSKSYGFGVCYHFFFSPAAGPLPGVALSGEQPPAARCAGAWGKKKNKQIGV